MPVSPDTDAIYQEAIDLQPRVEEYERQHNVYRRVIRDEHLALLANGFMADAAPETRIIASHLRADQIVEEKHPELYAFITKEAAAIRAINTRNEGIIAAGWAENFALNSWSRRLGESEKPGELGQ